MQKRYQRNLRFTDENKKNRYLHKLFQFSDLIKIDLHTLHMMLHECKTYNVQKYYVYTVCPSRLVPFYKVTYYIKRVNTSWTYSNNIFYKFAK